MIADCVLLTIVAASELAGPSCPHMLHAATGTATIFAIPWHARPALPCLTLEGCDLLISSDMRHTHKPELCSHNNPAEDEDISIFKPRQPHLPASRLRGAAK